MVRHGPGPYPLALPRGLYAADATLAIGDCVIEGNFAEGYGGGVLLDNSSARLIRTVVQANSAGKSASGIFVLGNSRLLMEYSAVTDHDASGGFGAGLTVGAGGLATLISSTVSGNTALSGGSAILAWGDVVLLYSSIAGNDGAAVWVGQDGRLAVGSSVLADNTAGSGFSQLRRQGHHHRPTAESPGRRNGAAE